jgi:hypothetical protein
MACSASACSLLMPVEHASANYVALLNPERRSIHSDNPDGIGRPAAGPPFGVNLHPIQGHPLYSEGRMVNLARTAGAEVIRIDVHWDWLEPHKSSDLRGEWSAKYIQDLNAFLDSARANGIQVMADVVDTPCWEAYVGLTACQNSATPWAYAPRSDAEFAGFIQRFISFAHGRVQYYEIWGEPNVKATWIARNPVAAYVNLVRASYTAIKAANSALQVVGPGTSYVDQPALDFIKRFYQLGGDRYVDALSVHPYTDGTTSPTDASCPQPPLPKTFQCGIEAVHQIMLSDPKGPQMLWLTEFGVPTTPGSQVDEPFQATFLSEAVNLIRSWNFIAGAIWYDLYDESSTDHFGLFRSDLSPKPVAYQFPYEGGAPPLIDLRNYFPNPDLYGRAYLYGQTGGGQYLRFQWLDRYSFYTFDTAPTVSCHREWWSWWGGFLHYVQDQQLCPSDAAAQYTLDFDHNAPAITMPQYWDGLTTSSGQGSSAVTLTLGDGTVCSGTATWTWKLDGWDQLASGVWAIQFTATRMLPANWSSECLSAVPTTTTQNGWLRSNMPSAEGAEPGLARLADGVWTGKDWSRDLWFDKWIVY